MDMQQRRYRTTRSEKAGMDDSAELESWIVSPGLLRIGGEGFGRESVVDDVAVKEMNGALGVVGVARVVRDHADGCALV